MSDRRQSVGNGELPLPSPRSPRQLDEKILAYARDNAPEKKLFLPPRWVAGLATAGVVVLALFITEPQQPTPTFREFTPSLEENLPADAASAEKAKNKPAAPAARLKMSRSAGQAAPIDKYEFADEPMSDQETATDAMANTVEADHVEADQDMAHSAIQPLEQTATDRELQIFTNEELRDKLQLYANMVEKGEGERARAAYQQLRQACPDCALPDTLSQAITKLLESEQPELLEQ
jgi:hypothetical protein